MGCHSKPDICRLCACTFPKGSIDKPTAKYSCSLYKANIESFFSLTIQPEDPPNFCQKCLTYMVNTQKRGGICKRFVKRLWPQHCPGVCEMCAIAQSQAKGGRPSKLIFQMSESVESNSGKHYHLLPQSNMYDLLCPGCCYFFSPQVCVLKCGHMVCKSCVYTSGSHVKCAKCINVCLLQDILDVNIALTQDIPVVCTQCDGAGVAKELYNHNCNKIKKRSRPSITQLTVGDLLSDKTSSEARTAAKKVSSTWLPHLIDKNGVFSVRGPSGKVSTENKILGQSN